MQTSRLAGSAALLTGATVIALTIAACGPTASSSTAPDVISISASPTTSTSAPPASSSGSPTDPAHVSQPKGAVPPPVGSVPFGGDGTVVPLPPYTPVPSSQIRVVGTAAQQPAGVQTAEGGRMLIFHEEQAGCQQVTAQLAGQNANQVVIDVTVSSTATAGRMCPMIIRVVPVTVQLSAPLGSRTVVFQQTLKH